MPHNVVVRNEGSSSVCHKLPSVSFQEMEAIGSDIVKKHPKGKALTILTSQGDVWYQLTVEESEY